MPDGTDQPQPAARPAAARPAAARPAAASPLAESLAAMPAVARDLHTKHRDRGDGYCGGCTQPQAGPVRWPCRLSTASARALDLIPPRASGE